MDSELDGPPRRTRFNFKLRHDMALFAQVQAHNPTAARKPNRIWGQIARNLSESRLEMPVTARTCKDRTQNLYNRLQAMFVVEAKEVREWMKQPTMLLERLRKLRETTSGKGGWPPGPRPSRVKLIGSEGGASDKSQSRSPACMDEVRDPLSLLSAPEFEFRLDGGAIFEDAGEFSSTKDRANSVPGSHVAGGSGEEEVSLSQRLLVVEKLMTRLVDWTKRQDTVNQEILDQIKSLRQANQTVGLPNPCVRLERLEKGQIPSASGSMTWRKTRTDHTYDYSKARPKSKSMSTRRVSTPPSRKAYPESDNGHGDDFDSDFALDFFQSPVGSSSNYKEGQEERSQELPVTVKLEVDSSNPPSEFDLEQDVDGFMAMAASLSTSHSDEGGPPEAATESGAQRLPKSRAPRHPMKYPKKKATEAKEVMCDQCSIVVKSVGTLRQHQLSVHEGHRPHICATCGRSFARVTALENHELTHSSERAFKCKYCETSFRQPQGLYIHERRHFVGTRYGRSQCAQCGQLFVSDYNMRKHVLVVHAGIRAYKCHLCGKPFKTQTHLKYHLGTHQRPGGRQRGLNREPAEGDGAPTRIKRVGGVSKLKPVPVTDLELNADMKSIGGGTQTQPVAVAPTAASALDPQSLIP